MYKRFIQGKKAVFFDLDGTLADTDPLWKKAFEKVLFAEGLEYLSWEDTYAPSIEDRWEAAQKNSSKKSKLSIKELTDHTITELNQILKNTPLEVTLGFWDLAYKLKEEKKMKLALVSNSKSSAVKIILDKLGIENTFDLIIASDEVKHPKPDPEIYLTAAKKLGVTPQEVLVFEDSLWGAKSACRANMDVIVIWNRKIMKIEYPDKVKEFMNSFEGIADKLDYTAEEYLKKAAEEILKTKTP